MQSCFLHLDPCVWVNWESSGIPYMIVGMAIWRISEPEYIVEHLSPGIHTCFELRMDVSNSTLLSRFESLIVHELWLTLHYCFCLFGVDSNLHLFNTQQASVSLRCWHTECFFVGHLTIKTLASFRSSLDLPSTGLDPLINKLLFSSLMIRWLRFVSLKNTFEACFACSTQYFSRSVAAHLSAPLHGLSRSKLPIEAKAVCFTYPLHSLLVSAR